MRYVYQFGIPKHRVLCKMYNISRFLPRLSDGRPGLVPDQTLTTGENTPEDDLLGLQRVMKDAQNPRRPVIGSWIMLPGVSLARMVARMGYDFTLIDCEHGDIDDAEMFANVAAVAAEGCSPIVRIPHPQNVYVKRALDAGAHGILVPSMSTVEDAIAVVQYAKFPVVTKTQESTKVKDHTSPAAVSGIRGVGSPFAPAAFRQTFSEYVRTANRNTFIAVQIETLQGLENCEGIANVDGIDMLFIGPNDLAACMGYPFYEHESIPEVQEAVQRVLTAAKKAGKYAGMFCTEAKHVRARFNQGFDLMNLAGDVTALNEWNAAQLAQLNDITGKGK